MTKNYKSSAVFLGLHPDEIIVDQFAGGGGASLGMSWATSRSPDIAVNHNPEAIAMHTVAHPGTTHYIEDVWRVDPLEACAGRSVGLMWMSPTCTHFSKARGAPLSQDSIKLRSLAWIGIRWAAAVRPRIICLENVEEFLKWGPLHRQHSPGCPGVACLSGCEYGRKKVKTHSDGCLGTECAKGCCIYRPIKSRQGETFRAFVQRLEKLGYVVEWRLMRACDYGSPTSRRRLVLVARRDGLPIVWPEPSHGPTRGMPYRTAAECIDWSNLGKSIFDEHGNTRHAEKTLRRVAAGFEKYVAGARRPFIVPMAYGTNGKPDGRTNDVDQPAPTICGARGGHAVVAPILTRVKTYSGGGNQATSVEDPLRTITCSKGGEYAVVSPLLVHTAHGEVDASGKRRGAGTHSADEPIGTVCAGGGDFAVVSPYLVHRSNGERAGQVPRTYAPDRPLGTVMAGGQKHAAVAALLIKHNGGHNDACGSAGQDLTDPVHTIATRDQKALTTVHLMRYNGAKRDGESRGQTPDEPIATLDTSNRYAVVASHLVKMRGTSDAHVASSGSSVEDPVPTLSAGGTHVAAVHAFLVRYNGGTNVGQEVGQPFGTLTQKPRFALVTVWIDGEEYVVADIFMRMLTPRELFTAMGFPPDYVIDLVGPRGKLSKTSQIMLCGNAVCPQLADAVVRAQLASTRAGTISGAPR